MTREEAWKEFDALAQQFMHMSGEEFLRRWDAREFGEEMDYFPVNLIAGALPLVR